MKGERRKVGKKQGTLRRTEMEKKEERFITTIAMKYRGIK